MTYTREQILDCLTVEPCHQCEPHSYHECPSENAPGVDAVLALIGASREDRPRRRRHSWRCDHCDAAEAWISAVRAVGI